MGVFENVKRCLYLTLTKRNVDNPAPFLFQIHSNDHIASCLSFLTVVDSIFLRSCVGAKASKRIALHRSHCDNVDVSNFQPR